MNTNKNIERFYETSENQVLKRAALLCLLSLMVACTNNKIVVETDDSVEYKSARSISPLIKPKGLEIETQVVNGKLENSIIERAQSINSDSSLYETRNSASQVHQGVSNLISQEGTTRLMIESDWDTAWDYLVTQLNDSGLTVFSRNKSAGRIAIGCGEVGDEVDTDRSGGWSIFNRRTEKASEYCSLQMKDKGNSVLVSVLDRVGREAPQKESQSVLSGLATK